MKISTPKSPPASRPAEPPKASTGGNGNTGIVPPSGKNTGIVPPSGKNTGIVPPSGKDTGSVSPGDSFQPTTPAAGKGGTSAATGAAPAALAGSGSTSTYALSPNLEPFRELFDKEGERIANLPAQQQQPEIEATSSRLFEQLKDVASKDEIVKGLTEAVMYYRRGTTGNDPMTYMVAADAAAGTSLGGGLAQEPAQDIGTPFNPSPPSKDEGRLPRFGREQQAEEESSQRFRRMRRFF